MRSKKRISVTFTVEDTRCRGLLRGQAGLRGSRIDYTGNVCQTSLGKLVEDTLPDADPSPRRRHSLVEQECADSQGRSMGNQMRDRR
jgi:hypothetical protein